MLSNDATDEEVLVSIEPPIVIITINRPKVRNAVDGRTAKKLVQAFRSFEENKDVCIIRRKNKKI